MAIEAAETNQVGTNKIATIAHSGTASAKVIKEGADYDLTIEVPTKQPRAYRSLWQFVLNRHHNFAGAVAGIEIIDGDTKTRRFGILSLPHPKSEFFTTNIHLSGLGDNIGFLHPAVLEPQQLESQSIGEELAASITPENFKQWDQYFLANRANLPRQSLKALMEILNLG